MKKELLPILEYSDQIVSAIRDNSVVVITAETGAGKSTQVPQFLMGEGYKKIAVTQPRQDAAETVAERVAEEMDGKLGDIVGFRHGDARMDSKNTRILFCTDGLQLVRELTGSGQADVLIIDEVHEWNLNIETLVAWSRKKLEEGIEFKVVLMSATLDAESLAKYMAGIGINCPVIKVPGRQFPCEKHFLSASQLLPTIQKLVEAKKNVLVALPGKREISKVISELEGIDAEVFPYHGEVPREERRKVFQHYARPKVIVATNAAKTSITIPDLDAVVSAGMENRIELKSGVEGLFLRPTSQADENQWAGRAARVKAGEYYLCSDESFEDRPAFPTAEIHRVRLDQLDIKLKMAGFDLTQLKFFHQPDEEAIKRDRLSNIKLGVMKDDGSLTDKGRFINRYLNRVSVPIACMVYQAIQHNEGVDDILTIAACLEAGGIRDRSGKWASHSEEKTSDLLADLDLYNFIRQGKVHDFKEIGVFGKNYRIAQDIRSDLADAMRRAQGVYFGKASGREAILKCVVAGMVDHLYEFYTEDRYGRQYKNGGNGYRTLSKDSAVQGRPKWIVGRPFDLEIPGRRGRFTINLVGSASAVDPNWLTEVAPQLTQIEQGLNPVYNAEQDSCFSTTRTHFNGQKVKEEQVATLEHPEAAKVFRSWLAKEMTI